MFDLILSRALWLHRIKLKTSFFYATVLLIDVNPLNIDIPSNAGVCKLDIVLHLFQMTYAKLFSLLSANSSGPLRSVSFPKAGF